MLFREDMEEGDDGSVTVTFGATDIEWAVSTVLSYSGLAIALEPQELCDLVAERAEWIAGQY